MKNNTIDANLLKAQVAIENASGNKVINTALTQFGYDNAKLIRGKNLYNDAITKQSKQKQEYGDQYQATDDLDATKAEANALYMKHVKIARIALNGKRGAWQALDLDGRRKQTFSGWVSQATVFYTNAQADKAIMASLAKFGITTKDLNDGLEKAKEVGSKLATQLKEKGEAQDATQVRDKAFDDLQDWMSDFIAIARIALEDQPQMLEVLGIIEPS